jgi:hypothetical protein
MCLLGLGFSISLLCCSLLMAFHKMLDNEYEFGDLASLYPFLILKIKYRCENHDLTGIVEMIVLQVAPAPLISMMFKIICFLLKGSYTYDHAIIEMMGFSRI